MKVVFEKSIYGGGRYLVEVGRYGAQEIVWKREGRFSKKSSAIAQAELLIAAKKYDRVRVIDTEEE